PAGHGSRPLQTNAVVHLARAIAAVATWQPPVVLNDTTRTFFQRLAEVSEPESANPSGAVVRRDPAPVADADAGLRATEPNYASMLRTSVSPNIIQGGY